MCARTLCPFSSSTRNWVLGNASVTVPSTSMTSSLAKDLLRLSVSNRYKMDRAKRQVYHAGAVPPNPYPTSGGLLGEHPGTVLRDGDGVLAVGGQRAVGGVYRPPVP